jgi:hypothetical protein
MFDLHVSIKDLPDSLQRALDRLGYHSKDITVDPATSYDLQVASGDGQKGFCTAVNLLTGQSETVTGSWGGANIFNPTNPVDLDSTTRDLPEGFAIIKGHTGSRMFAFVLVHPNNLQKLLPPRVEVTEQEQRALGCFGLKSAYRQQEFNRYKLGRFDRDNPIIASLQAKGLVKINANGSIQVTTQGKNARKE